jgi:hypothetical protein
MTLLLCAGCATDNPAPQAFAPAPGQASITIIRSSSLMYMGAPASVDVNGARVANLNVGQSYTGAVSPGPTAITVSAWSSPGASSFRFNVEPGKSYRFVVGPRSENTVSGMLGGAIGQSAEGGGPFQVSPASL